MTVITASGSTEVGQWGTRKKNGGGGLPLANGQAASAQIADIQWAVGGPLVKPSADLWLQPLPPVDHGLTTLIHTRMRELRSFFIKCGDL